MEYFKIRLVRTLGPGFSQYFGYACMLLGLWGLIIWFILFYYTKSTFFIRQWYICLFFIVLTAVGFILSSSSDYYRLTKCERCGCDFSCRQVGSSDITEVIDKEGTRIKTTIRSYKCDNCGHIKSTKETYTIHPSYPIYGEQP
jgi:hypothetical protein